MSSTLEVIVESFNLNEQILTDRRSVAIHIEPLASLIADRFYDYLLLDYSFANLISTSEIPRLKKLKAKFIIALFQDEFDEKTIQKIVRFYKDLPIKLNSYKIASLFDIAVQTIIDITSVNHQLQRQLKTILKFLHIAQIIIQKEFESDNKAKINISKNHLINAIESLFEMLSIHKTKHDYLVELWHKDKVDVKDLLNLPSADVSSCRFDTTISNIKNLVFDIEEFGIDIKMIDEWHHNYHKSIKLLYNSIESHEPKELQQVEFEKVMANSQKLFDYINKPFEQVSSLTFITVNAGLRFIAQYGYILSETKYIPFTNSIEMVKYIKTIFNESLKNTLLWAIESYEINDNSYLQNSDILEKITVNNINIYISLNVKKIPYKTFIFDVLYIFLEILKITLTNREKEHKLALLADKAETANRSKDIFLANSF